MCGGAYAILIGVGFVWAHSTPGTNLMKDILGIWMIEWRILWTPSTCNPGYRISENMSKFMLKPLDDT